MKTLITASIICFGFALASCGNMNNQNNVSAGQQDDGGFFSTMFGGSGNNIEYVSVTEPNEQAFTVNVPKGWKADVAMLRRGGGVKNVGSITSPDGKVHIFFGDPNLPVFSMPNPQSGMYEGMNTGNPLFQIRQFIPADNFFQDYTTRKFGNNQGFKIVRVSPNNEVDQKFKAEFNKQGTQAQVTTADVIFEYQIQGQTFQGKISGVCMRTNSVWVPVVSGYTAASGEAATADKCLAELNNSFKTNEQWQQRENQNYAMQSQQRHQQNMQMMQSSFNAHQNRMRANQSSFDSYMNSQRDLSNTYDQANQSWMNSQQSMDRSHENFVDYIRDEQRIGNGESYTKVQSGYDNYYVNQNEGTYIGTNSQFDVAPDGYEQWNPEY